MGYEVDNDIKGNGNSYTTEFRQYDSRLGRWLSIDPRKENYPDISPYVAFANNPIIFTDTGGDTIRIFGTNKEQFELYTLGDDDKLYDYRGNLYVQGTDSYVDGIYNDLQMIYNSGNEGQRLITDLSKEKDIYIQFGLKVM